LSFSGKYTIQFKGLKDGQHPYEFELNEKFFEFFANTEVDKGNLLAKVLMVKKTGLLELDITIQGTVNVLCDRCLEKFDLPLNYQGCLFVKFSESETESEDPDVIFLHPEAHQIDLSGYLYESIILSLPYRKVHPEGKKAQITCNPEMLQKLRKIVVTGKKETDPRWDKLKVLKDDKNEH